MPTANLVTPGELVKTARLRAGMKQQQLADELDVHRNTVGSWESSRDTAEPSASQFFAVIRITKQTWILEQLTVNNDIAVLSHDGPLPGQLVFPELQVSAA